jgi:DNA-binding NarL/FixJ family response regulator
MAIRSPITVAIAHFDDLFALGLQTLLNDDPTVSIVTQNVAHDRLAGAIRAHVPSVLIADADALPDLAQVRELSVQHPHTRLVLFTHGLPSSEAAQLLAFGASACLTRGTQARDVLSTVHLASRGLQVTPLAAHDPGAERARDPLLTRREGDVLLLLRQGQANAQIALELHISVETVRTHARSIYRKLGVNSRRALIALPTPSAEAPAPPEPTASGPARHRPAAAPSRRRPTHT